MESYGASCEQQVFKSGFAPNVVCSFTPTSNSTEHVILSAHYDPTLSLIVGVGLTGNPVQTTMLLVIHSHGIKFRRPVQLIAFSGEAQGWVGSRAYAKELKRQNISIALAIQGDMLAYRAPGASPQLDLAKESATPEANNLLSKLSKVYAPELQSALFLGCCSDHQSFYEQGYPATAVTERSGPHIVDPMNHRTGDLSDRTGYDVEQIRSISKVTFSALLEIAGFDLPVLLE